MPSTLSVSFVLIPATSIGEAVKRIIRYLKGTVDKKLEYSKAASSEIGGIGDADKGGDPDSRRSTTGYCLHCKVLRYPGT